MVIRSIDYCDPLKAFQVFENDPVASLLHGNARYSFIAAEPYRAIEDFSMSVAEDDALTIIEKELGKGVTDSAEIPAPFFGGAIGYFGYELGGLLERLPQPKLNTHNIPYMAVGFYDTVAVFDHDQRKAFVVGSNEEKCVKFAIRIAEAKDLPLLDWSKTSEWQTVLSRDEVEKNIQRVIDYIYAGDIFQANYTQSFTASRPEGLSDFDIYRRLYALSPAPFSAFLRCGAISVASASPEQFLKLQPDGMIETRPIKGTRPRDKETKRDQQLAEELRLSAKDRAENLMIVDLMRSDLSRVCEIGSIKVPKLCELETFSSVHHLVSIVTGKKRVDLTPIDVLRATFPGGSITGAPKIRAMEIIHELEPSPRGVYCGCIGWIGFNGAMDMSMAIRTLTITPDTLLAQAGGGIVADSDPLDEYEESMVKIAPLLRAATGENK